jgi:hypothetical protein
MLKKFSVDFNPLFYFITPKNFVLLAKIWSAKFGCGLAALGISGLKSPYWEEGHSLSTR